MILIVRVGMNNMQRHEIILHIVNRFMIYILNRLFNLPLLLLGAWWLTPMLIKEGVATDYWEVFRFLVNMDLIFGAWLLDFKMKMKEDDKK